MDCCEEFFELISQSLDGQLTPEQEQTLALHLSQCPSCNALAQELAAVSAACADLEDIPPPQGFARGVMDKVNAQQQSQPKVVPFFHRPQVKIVTGLAACALLCVGLYRGGLFSTTGGGSMGFTSVASAGVGQAEQAGAGAASATPDAALDETMMPENYTAGGDAGVGNAAPGVPQDSPAPSSKNSISSAGVQSSDAPAPGAQNSGTSGAQAQESGGSGSGVQGGEAPDSTLFAQQPNSISPAVTGAGTDERGFRSVYGDVVAVLTLTALPQGGEEILTAQIQWQEDTDGRYCQVTQEQLIQLMTLAQEQGQDTTQALEGETEGSGTYLLVIQQGS